MGKRLRNSKWTRWDESEALNKGFSRSLKDDKVGFVQLFVEYGAEIDR
jgi:hypothetical protein